jgi:hypothetical protein
VIDGSPPPRLIRDWRDWMNEFPKVAALAIFVVVAWVVDFVMVHALGIWSQFSGVAIQESVLRLLNDWGDKLIWLTPFAVAAIVGKRATEKPEVIRAEGEVKAAVVAAQTGTYPVAVTEAVPVTTAETAPPLTHRESERGE